MRRFYGASPVHLLAHLAAFALVAWVLAQAFDLRGATRVLVWLLAAAILHDFLLLPVYSLLDRVARRALPRGPAVNHLRFPAGISLLLLLVFFPVISARGEPAYESVSGLTYDGYAERWLLVSLGLFLLSGALYLVRGRRATSRS